MPGRHPKPRANPRAPRERKGTSPGHAAPQPRRGYRLDGRLWISKDDETFLAFGRVTLLERIREHGSISAAARSMEMSYRHAWELVESMNRLARKPLVSLVTGGRGGGGAGLTPAGRAAIDFFWKEHEALGEFLRTRPTRVEEILR